VFPFSVANSFAANDELINMKKSVKTICSAIAFIAFIALMLYRSALISSSECAVDPKCLKAEIVGVMGWIAGLYLAIELVIAPETSILVIIQNGLPGGKLSSESYRASGVVGIFIMLTMLYTTVTQIIGGKP
jgi:hypothetical protein